MEELPADTEARKNPFEATQLTPGLTFEQRYKECVFWVERKRRSIDLASISWDDIRQKLLIRISQQYHIFDPAKGPFKHWVNKVITNGICNIWRDEYKSYARPCVGCVDNLGGTTCRRTPSGTQCAQCPAYREWEGYKNPVTGKWEGGRKKAQHDIKLAVSMENHMGESHSVQSDFIDVSAKKKIIDAKMKGRLNRMEYRAYKMLMIQGKSEEEVGIALGFKSKKGKKTRMWPGYLAVLSLRHKFVEIAKAIIDEEDLAA